jgi:hypothetical protein
MKVAPKTLAVPHLIKEPKGTVRVSNHEPLAHFDLLLGHTQSTALPEKSNQNTTLYKKNKN